MELTNDDLSKLKEKELEMLKLFLNICQKHDLQYYVLGGTLLGAVRHQGFIPWDDDIDVGMPRKDYQRFLQMGQHALPEGFFLQTHITDPGFPANFAKLRNDRTTFVEYSMKDCPIHHGIYIDIFPLDFYPEHFSFLFDLKHLLLKLRITDAFSPGNMKLSARLLRRLSRLLYPSVRCAVLAREQLFRSVSETACLANHCGAWGKKEAMPRSWYAEGALLPFEDLDVLAPKEYDRWLTQVYGDYQKLPPADQQIPHHHIHAFDVNQPYRKEARL